MTNHQATLTIKSTDPQIHEILKVVNEQRLDYSLINTKLVIKIGATQNEVGAKIMKLASDWNLK